MLRGQGKNAGRGVMHKGASMELGYTFWQGAFRKNTKTYLDQAIFKPSIEVITPRSRV